MNSHKGLRENLAISVPPLLFYTSVTWVWSHFLAYLLLSTRSFNWEICVFASFKLTCRPYWPGNMGSKKKMEHRTIFIGTVFIIRAFMDLLRTNICSLLTCKSHLLNIVFYIFEIIPLSKIWSVFKSIVGICLQEYNAHDWNQKVCMCRYENWSPIY